MSGGRSASWGAGANAWAGGGEASWGGAQAAAKPAWQAAAGKGAAAPQGPKAAFTVTSKYNEVTHKTLVGSYAEQGENHGRKAYKKMEKITGHENVSVYLYYWDQRDGADFSGWWFGDQVGGTQVWSRAALHTPAPPKGGWLIPWDTQKPEPGALTVEAASSAPAPAAAAGGKAAAPAWGKAAAPAGGKAAAPANGKAAVAVAGKGAAKGVQAPAAGAAANNNGNAAAQAQRLKAATGKVTMAEAAATSSITSAKSTLENKAATEGMLKVQVDKLEAQKTKLQEALTSLNADMAETRKGGPSAMASVNEYAKLTPTVKTAMTAVATELFKVKSAHQKFAAEAKKVAEEKAKKAAEEKEKQEFKTVLPKIKLEITKIENAVTLVEKAAAPMINSPPEDGEEKTKNLEKIEKDAEEAQKKFTDVRTDLNTKIANARKYTGETKNEALKELNALQVKLTEAQKKLNPYKNFKKEFVNRVAAKKALKEISDKVAAAEPEVKKATALAAGSESGQMSEEEVAEADKVINPTNTSLQQVLSTINNKSRGADASTQAELEALRTKVNDLKKKLDEASTKVKSSRQNLSVQKGLSGALEKIEKAEAALAKCQEAEMPFLKGIEVLPKEESDQALGDSDKAAAEANSAVMAASSGMKQLAGQSKSYPKEMQQSVEEQLKPLQKRASTVETKVANFKKETAERKTNAILAEVVEAISSAEEKVTKLVDCTSAFAVDKLDDVSIAEITEASKSAEPVAKEAQAAIDDARKNLQAKQRNVKGNDAAAALNKINERLKVAQEKMVKARSSIQIGDKCCKAKQALEQQGEKLAAAEAFVDKAAGMAGEDANLTQADVKVLDENMVSALNALRPIQQAVQPHMGTPAAKLKASLQGLLDRKAKAQEKLDKTKSTTKTLREKVLSEAYTKEAEAKLVAVEAAIEATSDAELPFLKGIEVLPLKEATDTVAASEKASTAARDAIKQAQDHIRSKTAEVKEFAEDAKKSVTSCFNGLNSKISDANQKLTAFNKDTTERKRNAQVREADVKVGEAEEAAKLAVSAAEPFAKEDCKDLSEEVISGLMDKFMAAEKTFKDKMSESRSFVQARERDAPVSVANKETLKKLQARLGEAQSGLTKVRQPIRAHEDKFTAKRLLAEAKEAVLKLDAEVKTASDACAPLIDQAGEDYLVTASIGVLSQALLDHAKEKELDEEAVYKEASGGKKLSQKKFLEYLAGLAAALKREELNFSEERRTNIFKKLDADKDGFVSKDEYKSMFRSSGVVKKEISVSEGFSIADSKALGKVAPGDKVETFGVPKEDDAKMVRTQCKLLKDDSICWITLKQANVIYVHATSNAFGDFFKGMEAAISTSDNNVRKTTTEIEGMLRQLSSSSSVHMKEAKEEINKLKVECTTASTSLRTLKGKVNNGKESLKVKEREEKNAHIIAKEINEAKEIYGSITPKVEELEAAAAAIEEKGKPLIEAEDKDKFVKPASLLEEVEKLSTDAAAKVDAARALAKEQMQVAAKVSPATPATGRAKKEIQQYITQIEKSGRRASGVLANLTKLCNAIADKHVGKVSTALRDEAAKKGGAEKLFADLAKKSDKISPAAFSKKVSSLAGLGVEAEHASLLCRRIESGGIGQRSFLTFVQLYYVVVKDIAMTDNQDIKACTTIRKIEKKELLEVLEGPVTDEKLGITRVKAKSLLDCQVGWVSVSGNQGTPFLERREKPFYATRKETTLDNTAKSGGGAVRTLLETEILELIEGPKVEIFPDASKARVKATKDGAQGWVTLRDRDGTVFGEANNKLFVCKAAVAMTDALDIQSSKVLRKLAVDEHFVATTGELVEDKVAGIFRLQGKALKDDKEGWITTRGNAGTVFAELTPKMYSVLKDVNVYKNFTEDSKQVVRKLEAGETFKVLEGPKEEKVEAENRIKVRAVSDKAIGWISDKPSIVKTWAPVYRCTLPTSIRDTRGKTEVTNTVKELNKNDMFEHVEGPFFEDKEIVMKCKTKKDGIVGWVTIKAADGKRHVEF